MRICETQIDAVNYRGMSELRVKENLLWIYVNVFKFSLLRALNAFWNINKLLVDNVIKNI